MGERVHLVRILFGVFYFGARTFYYWLFFQKIYSIQCMQFSMVLNLWFATWLWYLLTFFGGTLLCYR